MKITPFLERRIKFLIDESKIEEKASQDTKLIMRVISNYATIGKDGSSSLIYRLNSNLSKKALDSLKAASKFEEWIGGKQGLPARKVINEHRLPLDDLWIFLKNNNDSITVKDIWEIFIKNPMITILLEEDQQLRNNQSKIKSTNDRYENASIVVVKLDSGAFDFWKNR